MALPPLEGEVKITTNADKTFSSIQAAALKLGSQLTQAQNQVKLTATALTSLSSIEGPSINTATATEDLRRLARTAATVAEEIAESYRASFQVNDGSTSDGNQTPLLPSVEKIRQQVGELNAALADISLDIPAQQISTTVSQVIDDLQLSIADASRSVATEVGVSPTVDSRAASVELTKFLAYGEEIAGEMENILSGMQVNVDTQKAMGQIEELQAAVDGLQQSGSLSAISQQIEGLAETFQDSYKSLLSADVFSNFRASAGGGLEVGSPDNSEAVQAAIDNLKKLEAASIATMEEIQRASLKYSMAVATPTEPVGRNKAAGEIIDLNQEVEKQVDAINGQLNRIDVNTPAEKISTMLDTSIDDMLVAYAQMEKKIADLKLTPESEKPIAELEKLARQGQAVAAQMRESLATVRPEIDISAAESALKALEARISGVQEKAQEEKGPAPISEAENKRIAEEVKLAQEMMAKAVSPVNLAESEKALMALDQAASRVIRTISSGREGIAVFQNEISKLDIQKIEQLSRVELEGIVHPRALVAANKMQGIVGELSDTILRLKEASDRGLGAFQEELQKTPALLQSVQKEVDQLGSTIRNVKGFRPEESFIGGRDKGDGVPTDFSVVAREMAATQNSKQAVDTFIGSVAKLSQTMDMGKAISKAYNQNFAQIEGLLGEKLPFAVNSSIKTLDELAEAFGRVKKAEVVDPTKARIEVERARAARFRESAQAIRDSGGEHSAFGLPGGGGGVSRGGLRAAGQVIGQIVPGTHQLQSTFFNLTRLAPELTAALDGTTIALAGVAATSLAVAAGIVGIVAAADRMEIVNRQAEKLKETFGDSQKVIDDVQEAIGGRASEASIKPIMLQVDAKSALAELDNFAKVSDVVQQRADELGVSWAESMPKVVESIKSGNYSQLEQMGILDSSQRAFALYAQELGTTTDKLTDVQREQAILNRVINEFEPKELEDKTTTLGKSFDTMAASFKDAASAAWEWFVAGTAIVANNFWENLFGKSLVESADSLISSVTGMFSGIAEAARTSTEEARAALTPLGLAATEVAKAQDVLTAAMEGATIAENNYVAAQVNYANALTRGTAGEVVKAKAAFDLAFANKKSAEASVEAAEANKAQAEATQAIVEKVEAARAGIDAVGVANQQAADTARTFSDSLADLAVALDRVQQGANSSALSIASRLVPAMGVSGAYAQAEQWQADIQKIRSSIDEANSLAGEIIINEDMANMYINSFTGYMSATTSDMVEMMRDTGDEAIAQAKRIKNALDGALKGMAEGVTKPSTSGLLNWDIGSLKSKMDKEGTKFADAFGISFEDAMKKYGGNIDLITLFAGREDEVDEKARRLGTVLVSGFKSEYFDELRADGLIPQDVIDKGEAAVRKFSANMLREHEQGFVPALYDSAKVAEKVFDQIQTKAKRNEFMDGVIAQVKEMGASADELDIYDALGIDTSSERAARKMTADFGSSLEGILTQIQEQGKTTANVVSTMQTPADKMGEVTTAQTIKLKLAGTTAATSFGEQMVSQTVQGKYGDRSVDQMLLEVDGRQEDVKKRGKIMGGWMGSALITEFSDTVPVGLVNVLVTASAPAVYAKVIEMLNDR